MVKNSKMYLSDFHPQRYLFHLPRLGSINHRDIFLFKVTEERVSVTEKENTSERERDQFIDGRRSMTS